MSAQLYNQLPNNYNLETINLKQLNNLDIHLGGGRKKKLKLKRKKLSKKSFQKKIINN